MPKLSKSDSAICWSARILAGQRAKEMSLYSESALVVDPFAEDMADFEGKHGGRPLRLDHANFVIRAMPRSASKEEIKRCSEIVRKEREKRPETLIRTKYIDLWLRANLEFYSQVCIIGAGLDMRPYRIADFAHSRVFEVDHQQVLEYKQRRLETMRPKPCCKEIYRVSGDLRGSKEENNSEIKWEEKLLSSGFDPDQPTIWIAEGILMYFGPNQVRRLLQSMAKLSAPNSKFIADIVSSSTLKSRLLWFRMFRWGCDEEDLPVKLKEFRWQLLSCERLGKDGISYGRYLADPLFIEEKAFPELTSDKRRIDTYIISANVIPKVKEAI